MAPLPERNKWDRSSVTPLRPLTAGPPGRIGPISGGRLYIAGRSERMIELTRGDRGGDRQPVRVSRSGADSDRKGPEVGDLAAAFDLQQPVVFCEPLGTRDGADLDLARAGGNRKIGEEIVFGFAGPRGDYGAKAGFAGAIDYLERLGEGADLVHFHQHGVGGVLANAALEPVGIGNEQIVADKLQLVAERAGDLPPARPVVLR